MAEEPETDPVLGIPCIDCGKSVQTLWCPAWSAHVCVWCRQKRTDRELNAPPKVAWPDLATAS